MANRRVRWTWFLVAEALLAGCAQGGSGTLSSTGTSAPSADVGHVSGIVVDDERVPIPEVTVGLLSDTDVRTVTDASGGFLLRDLVPGEHKLLAQKDGYRPSQAVVSVTAREMVQTTMEMKPLPRLEPRQANFIFDGYLGFDLAVPAGNQYAPGPGGELKRSVYYPVEQPDLVGAYAGIRWTGNIPVVSDRMYMLVYLALDKALNCDDAARTYCLPMTWAEGKSPQSNGSDDYQQHMRDRSDLRVNVRFRMRPCVTADVGLGWVNPTRCPNPVDLVKLAVDQKVTAYTTLFYGQPAPTGFSPLPP